MAHDSSIHNNRSKPVPRGQRNLNRARQYKRDTDNVPDVAISLMDLDSAIMYYFTEVIKPTVVDNGETVKVPIMYSSPERWSAIQKTGFMRDKKRQVILPVIAFRRTGMTKDTTIPLDTMDPEEPKLHWQFEKKYTDANRYDACSVQQGLIPQREFYNVAVPDFMVLNYDFIVWASYIEQMNKLVERINWSEGAYWGEPGKMKFRTSIDSYTDSTDVSGKERIVKTEFSVTLKGYLIPEAFNELAGPHTMQKHLTPKTLVIKSETDVTVPPLQEVLDGTQPFPDAVSGITQDRVQPITLGHAFTLSAGNGITLTNEGDSFDGATAVSHTISIPQVVNTTANVQFNSVTGSLLVGTTNSLTFNNDGITGDISITGSLTTTDDLSVTGSSTALVTEYAAKQYISGLSSAAEQAYLRKQYVKLSTSLVNSSTASFSAVTASAPDGMTSTSEHDFLFFINGQYMEHDALTIQQASSTFYLQVDTDGIGYDLESDDEILAWGKFNS
mgnify:CR=1 FL=1